MSEKKSVWVVEQGSYSDYGVLGVFSTREAAEMMAARINEAADRCDEEATVAEWPLDPGVDALRAGLWRFDIWMKEDGSADSVYPASDWKELPAEDPSHGLGNTFEMRILSVHPVPTKERQLRARVWARDREHAIKIANERRVQLVASGEWHRAEVK